MFSFYTSLKDQKTNGFRVFSGVKNGNTDQKWTKTEFFESRGKNLKQWAIGISSEEKYII